MNELVVEEIPEEPLTDRNEKDDSVPFCYLAKYPATSLADHCHL